MNVIIVGGGIVGLALGLLCKRHNIPCEIYEAAPEITELGVGITLLPHAMRELRELGLQDQLEELGIENKESCFFNRFGQLIYEEPRGRFAGYPIPELGIHRGKLHLSLYQEAIKELGRDKIHTGHQCVQVEQDDRSATATFVNSLTNEPIHRATGDVVVGCDGINSTVRKHFYPDESVVFSGINTWRGVTRHKPILTGKSYLRIGSIRTGKMVIYPIIDDYDDAGNQLINWMAEIETPDVTRNDWNRPGKIDDFYSIYGEWVFDWLDVTKLIKNAEKILEYPMVDKDPVARWSFERITLAGDAAHPMYPRGSNGSAQGLIDARVLSDFLVKEEPIAALKKYENERLAPTSRIIETNRKNPPDFINIRVEELTGDKPFVILEDFITKHELREMSDRYKEIAGFSLNKVST